MAFRWKEHCARVSNIIHSSMVIDYNCACFSRIAPCFGIENRRPSSHRNRQQIYGKITQGTAWFIDRLDAFSEHTFGKLPMRGRRMIDVWKSDNWIPPASTINSSFRRFRGFSSRLRTRMRSYAIVMRKRLPSIRELELTEVAPLSALQ